MEVVGCGGHRDDVIREMEPSCYFFCDFCDEDFLCRTHSLDEDVCLLGVRSYDARVLWYRVHRFWYCTPLPRLVRGMMNIFWGIYRYREGGHGLWGASVCFFHCDVMGS